MKPTYTAKADVFSFAMTCYEVVSGELPYSSDLPRQRINELVREGVRPELPKDINTRLSSLIQKCWQTEAPERPTFEKICFDLKEMKALETIAPERPTFEEICSDLQEMKALETIAPERPTFEEICSDRQELKSLPIVAQGRCTIS
jgi:serine/threonine protein kinase